VLEETASVIAVKHGRLLIETTARSACGHCSSSGCTTSVLAKMFGVRRNWISLPNTLGARVGDRVVVGVPDSVLVGASVLVYLLPLLTMIVAVVLADAVAADALAQVLMALAGLGLGFGLVRIVVERRATRNRYEMRLLRLAGAVPVRFVTEKSPGVEHE
jgi:sigma-E factor negative regulatory protein RseC